MQAIISLIKYLVCKYFKVVAISAYFVCFFSEFIHTLFEFCCLSLCRFLFAFDTSFAAGERLCGTLSYNDNITHSPAYGGRMKRNGKSGQLQRLDPQKQIGRTSSGENSLFSPLAISLSKRMWTVSFLFRKNIPDSQGETALSLSDQFSVPSHGGGEYHSLTYSPGACKISE